MWQRTQILVTLEEENKKTQSFAMHNQRGFGRPTVTSTIAIVEHVADCMNDNSVYYINKTNIHLMACRPYWWDELFNRQKPYNCKKTFDHAEHDNNDWYSIININIPSKTIVAKYYDYDGIEKSALKYIKDLGCEEYCDKERQKRYIKKTNKILKFVWNSLLF